MEVYCFILISVNFKFICTHSIVLITYELCVTYKKIGLGITDLWKNLSSHEKNWDYLLYRTNTKYKIKFYILCNIRKPFSKHILCEVEYEILSMA